MTTKILTGTYSGYSLKSPVTTLSITATGYVEGDGVVSGTLGAYTVVNAGRVNSAMNGVYLGDGGVITNASATRTTALIEGAYSAVFVRGAAGTVTNYGLIVTPGGGTDTGVYLGAGGVVTNGSGVDDSASIAGGYGVWIRGATGSVTNYGTILGSNKALAYASGVYIDHGGAVTNGTGGDTTALIEGFFGVYFRAAAGTVLNDGTIVSAFAGPGAGVLLGAGGSVVNGSATDHGALISGSNGVRLTASGTVKNFATIRGTGVTNDVSGVDLVAGGSVTNGAVNDRRALIEGYHGLSLGGPGASVNFGTIQGDGGDAIASVLLFGAATLVNGAVDDSTALIDGYEGARLYGGGTLTNFGTISGVSGASGFAVSLYTSQATLAVEAGSTFLGQVVGNGGTLDLASGAPVLAGLFGGGDVTVSGSMATTSFQGFGTLQVGPGTSATLPGPGVFAAGQKLTDDGSLSVGATLSSAGTVTLAGTLAGAGTLAVTGGTLTMAAGTSLSIAEITVAGAATAVDVATSLAYVGKWIQAGGALAVAKGDTLSIGNSADSLAGSLTGAGDVSVTGHLTVGAAGLTLTGGGILSAVDSTINVIIGASASTTLTNVSDRILGAGQLGDGALALVNEAGGVIDGDDSVALTINTGSVTIANAGDIEATAAGGTQILSAIANTGLLIAQRGTLTVSGPVTGSGSVHIGAGGTADFTSSFGQNVTFTSTSGVLELAKSQSYSGQVTGFSKSGSTSFDLRDITFGGPTKATYSGTAASGTLTVTDGVHTAHITLIGNYLSSLFKVSSDGGPGTKVIDPTGPGVGTLPPAPLAPFVAATAGFGASGASLTIAHDSWRPPPPSLSSPTAQIA